MPTHIPAPDGSIVEFPDGMADQQMESIMQKLYPPTVRGAGKTGLPPGSTQPIPPGLQGKPDSYFGPGIPSITHQGSQQMWHGLTNTEGSLGSRVADTIEGLQTGIAPAAIIPSVMNPAAAAGAAGLGIMGKGIGQFGSELAGASPDTSRAIGDVAGLAGGYLGSTPTAQKVIGNPGVWESVGNMIPFLNAGSKIRAVGSSISNALNPSTPETPIQKNWTVPLPSPKAAPQAPATPKPWTVPMPSPKPVPEPPTPPQPKAWTVPLPKPGPGAMEPRPGPPIRWGPPSGTTPRSEAPPVWEGVTQPTGSEPPPLLQPLDLQANLESGRIPGNRQGPRTPAPTPQPKGPQPPMWQGVTSTTTPPIPAPIQPIQGKLPSGRTVGKPEEIPPVDMQSVLDTWNQFMKNLGKKKPK